MDLAVSLIVFAYRLSSLLNNETDIKIKMLKKTFISFIYFALKMIS